MYLTFRANIGVLVILCVSGERFFLMCILLVVPEKFDFLDTLVFLFKWNRKENLKTHHF